MAKLRKILPYVGYSLFFVFVFVFSAYLTFPYDILRDRVVAEFVKSQSKTGPAPTLRIDRLEPSWFTGVEVEGVHLVLPPEPTVSRKKNKPTVVDIDSASARIGLMQRMFGTTSVDFEANLFGGQLSGHFEDSKEERAISLKAERLIVGKIKPIVDSVGLPLFGSLNGTVDLRFPEKRVSKATGNISLEINRLTVGDGKTKVQNFALPRMKIGRFRLEAAVTKGVVKVSKFGAKGGDVEIISEGKIRLKDRPNFSRLELFMRLKFADKLKSRNEKTKTLFGDPKSKMPAIIDLDPKMKRSKRKDGFYGWRVAGLVSKPIFSPFSGKPGSMRRGGSPLGGFPRRKKPRIAR